MYLSKLIHVYLRAVTWICENWYMDFCKLLHGFAKFFSCTLPNKLDQVSKACRSFYFEIKLLNESKYSMPWVHCAFGNVLFVRVCHSLSMCGVGGGIMEGECSDCVIGELSCSGDTCDSLGRSLRETNTQRQRHPTTWINIRDRMLGCLRLMGPRVAETRKS